jgi:RNA polymerase sigma-70 factor (ECF subfamily)
MNSCIQDSVAGGYSGVRINRANVDTAENQVVRFPGGSLPDELHDAVEAREDARLLAGIAGEDQHALAALYRRRGSLIYSLLVRMLVNEMEAQEVMQDTFVQIWRRACKYDPDRASPLAWMIMIARGLAWDRLRSRSRRNTTLAAFESEVASLEVEEVTGARQTERDELAAACAVALNGLPADQGRALQLAFLRGWTHEEIASAVGEPLGTIKARIRRGLLALRKALKDHHV